MELIYLYIYNYKDIFKEQGFNFSPNFHVSFNNNQLNVERIENNLSNYYGENISNVKKLKGEMYFLLEDQVSNQYSPKEKFIIYYLIHAILYYFFEELVGWAWNNYGTAEIELNKNVTTTSEEKDDGKISNFQNEYVFLLKEIENNRFLVEKEHS